MVECCYLPTLDKYPPPHTIHQMAQSLSQQAPRIRRASMRHPHFVRTNQLPIRACLLLEHLLGLQLRGGNKGAMMRQVIFHDS